MSREVLMITTVEIQNYRSCLETVFDLHPRLSVLIGPNSSGKTNILHALLLLRKLTEESQGYPRVDEELTRQCTLKVGFKVGAKRLRLSSSINLFTDETNNDIVFASPQQWYGQRLTGSRKMINVPLLLARALAEKDEWAHISPAMWRRMYYPGFEKALKLPDAVRIVIIEIAQELSEMRYYSASQFTNPGNCPVSVEVDKEGKGKFGMRLSGHAKFLSDLYKCSETEADTSYARFLEIVGPQGISLIDDIDFKVIPTSSIEYSVRSGGDVVERRRERVLVVPRFRKGRNDLSPNQLSEGTFKTITLLFYLITERSRILLLEEPEVCVHHGLLSSIIALIKEYSRDKQIVITTHSDFVLDHVQPEHVYSVTNNPGEGTRVAHITKSMSPPELSALREYLATEGNLGEYWRHGGLG